MARPKPTAKPTPKVFRIAGGRVAAEVKESKPQPASSPAPTIPTAPTHDEIRELAYRKWEAAGWPAGDGVEFWLAAERELAGGNEPS